jgi:hypothetical protein
MLVTKTPVELEFRTISRVELNSISTRDCSKRIDFGTRSQIYLYLMVHVSLFQVSNVET